MKLSRIILAVIAAGLIPVAFGVGIGLTFKSCTATMELLNDKPLIRRK